MGKLWKKEVSAVYAFVGLILKIMTTNFRVFPGKYLEGEGFFSKIGKNCMKTKEFPFSPKSLSKMKEFEGFRGGNLSPARRDFPKTFLKGGAPSPPLVKTLNLHSYTIYICVWVLKLTSFLYQRVFETNLSLSQPLSLLLLFIIICKYYVTVAREKSKKIITRIGHIIIKHFRRFERSGTIPGWGRG